MRMVSSPRPGGQDPHGADQGASGTPSPEPWGGSTKNGSTFGMYSLHHRNTRVQNWGFFFRDPPRALELAAVFRKDPWHLQASPRGFRDLEYKIGPWA